MQINIKWHLVMLDIPVELTGESILKSIKILTDILKLKFVIIDYIDGSQKPGKDWLMFNLQKKENKIIHLEDLYMILNDVQQFRWGDFFLFEEPPSNWLGEEDVLYPQLVAETDTTVRAIDGTYIYIYTPYEEIVEVLKKNYEIESITTDFLEDLSYPE